MSMRPVLDRGLYMLKSLAYVINLEKGPEAGDNTFSYT